jgi:anti-sigma factor RsiW
MDALSALVDGVLAAHARFELEAHAARCPACGAALATLNELHASFAALPDPRVGFDLAPAIADRIRAAGRPQAARPERERIRWWQAFPAAVGSAVALSAGAYLGAFLAASGAVVAGRPAIEMSAFGTVPPGGLCLGPACDARAPR